MATSKTKYGTKSRGTYAEVDPSTAVAGPYVRADGDLRQQLIITGELNAEQCGVYPSNTGAANVAALNSALARTDIHVIVFNNPKGASYPIAGATAVTVPYGKQLKFRPGNLLSGTGSIVFEENLPAAEPFPIFASTLSTRINTGRMTQIVIYPEWWGARSLWQPERSMTVASLAALNNIDSTVAIQKMIDSLYTYSFFDTPGQVAAKIILSGIYGISDQINLYFFYGTFKGVSQIGRSGSGFRWLVNATSNDTKVMFKCHGCEGLEWNTLSFWGYRDVEPEKQLKAIILPVLDSEIDPAMSQRRHRFINVNFGDPTGHFSNSSTEEQAITAPYFAKAAIKTEGNAGENGYVNGNNDFFQFQNVQFYNVQRGIWNRQSQAVNWNLENCQAGVIEWVLQFDFGGNIYVNKFFMEGYAVEQGFLNLLGSSNEYFFGQFEKVSMEDIKGTHFVNAEASFDLRFRDCSISFARSVGDVRPIYLCQYSGGGSISNLCFDGGSIHDVRGFFGADVQPGSVMQISFEDDTVGVLNTSFENKTEGTGFKHLVINRPIGNSLINISLDAFERYNLNSFDDYGTNYGFKKIKRIVHHYDTIWDDYPSDQLPLRDLIRDIGGKDEYQQNNKAFVLGEVGKSPSVKTKVDSFAHLTAESAHVIEISDFFPPYQTILGVGLSHQEQLFTLAEDRDNNSAHIGIGDQYDRFRWGFKPVGANHFYDFTQRAKAPSMTSVIYDKPESLFLSAFCMSPDDATLIDNILILVNPWFVESDEGKVFEFLEGELTGLEMTVINFIDSTHVEVTASMFSTSYPAAIIQQIDWIDDKAIVLTLYSQQGNYNEVIPGGRYANWFNELPIIT